METRQGGAPATYGVRRPLNSAQSFPVGSGGSVLLHDSPAPKGDATNIWRMIQFHNVSKIDTFCMWNITIQKSNIRDLVSWHSRPAGATF
jgi:hypothetical protein